MLIIVILIVGQGIPGQQPSIQGCQQQLPRYIGSIQDTSQENYLKLNYLWLLSSFLAWDCTHVDLSATQITFMLLSTSWWGTPADFLTSNRISSYFARNVNHILHVYSQFPEGGKTYSMTMYFQADGVGGSPGGGGRWGTRAHQCKCCFSALTKTLLCLYGPLRRPKQPRFCIFTVFYQNYQTLQQGQKKLNICICICIFLFICVCTGCFFNWYPP